MSEEASLLEVHPLTPDRWPHLETLFGTRGPRVGCWCMALRQTQAEFVANAGAGNRNALRRIVDEGHVPGLIAYQGGEPVGWCSVAPRHEFVRIEQSPALKPVDDRPSWAIVCFYVRAGRRGHGVATALLEAAVEWARSQGAELLEGYPRDPREGRRAAAGAAYTGVLTMFLDAGFEEVARRGARPIMRAEL